MSTPNFQGELNGFPLYVHEDIYAKICPECGAWNSAENDVCFECGEDLDSAEERYDPYETEEICEAAHAALTEINKDMDFFAVGLESGYYTGVQFTVKFKKHWGCEIDPEELDNEDAHYYFDCCRSVMLRRYERERRKLGKKLAVIAADNGFEEIRCVGIFSNGEAIYERVPKQVKKYGYKAKAAVSAAVSA